MGKPVTVVGAQKKEEKESKKELKKHAATIHCSNTLSLLQRKITNALLYHAYKELMIRDEHEISVKQLCRLIGYQGNNHAVIKDALRALISTVIEWNIVDDATGSENWTASSIIASVSLEGPMCYYAYSPRMKQLLHSPSMFGKIDLVIQSRFRSSYGLALYENCIRYRGLAHTKWFDMQLFKKLMGVPESKYDVFRDFKRRVLDKAIDEVNTYSDLIIAAEFVRERRKVTKIRFAMKERAKKTRLGTKKKQAKQINLEHKEIRETLFDDFNLSLDQIEWLLEEYSYEFIQKKLAMIVDSKPYRENKIQNLTAYLLSAVKNDYQATKQLKLVNFDTRLEEELTQLKLEVEQIRSEYNAYREQTIQEAIDSLDPIKREAFLGQFMAFAEPTIRTILRLQRNRYSMKNVNESPQIKALLRQFALRELDLINLINLEEFISLLSDEKIAAWQKLKSHDPDHYLLKVNE